MDRHADAENGLRAIVGLVVAVLLAGSCPAGAQSYRFVHPYEDKDGRWIGPNLRASPDATPLNDGWSRQREADPFVRRQTTRDAFGQPVYHPPPATHRVPTPEDRARRRY